MSGTILCNAENLDGISIESLVINSFNVDKINGLQHFVCTLSLVDNKKRALITMLKATFALLERNVHTLPS